MNLDDNPIELRDINTMYRPPEVLSLVPRKRSHSNEDYKLESNAILSGDTTPLNELL